MSSPDPMHDHRHVQSLPRRAYVTTRTHEVFALALRLAERLGHDDATDVHVALGMLHEGQSVAVAILHHRGVPLGTVANELEAELPPALSPRLPAAVLSWTPGVERVLAGAVAESRALDVEYHGIEHVLLALLRDPASPPARVLARYGVGYDDAKSDLIRLRDAPPGS